MTSLPLTAPSLMAPSGKFTHTHSPLRKRICRIIAGVAYLDRQLEIEKNKLVMSLYDKRDDFPFRVQNYPHLDSTVPCMPMYGVYISQLLRFAPACDRYSDFLARQKRLVRTLLDQGFGYGLLCRKFKQFYRSHHSLIQRYSHSVTQHLREGVDSQVR